MPHIHPLQSTPQRGAVVGQAEAAPSFRNFNATNTGSGSPAVEAAALGDGLFQARPVSATDFTSEANKVAAIVLPAAGQGRSHVIHGVDFGYSNTPTNGQLTISDGISPYRVPVTSGGVGPLDFKPPMIFAPNTQVSGSLSAGGAGISGYFGFSARAIV